MPTALSWLISPPWLTWDCAASKKFADPAKQDSSGDVVAGDVLKAFAKAFMPAECNCHSHDMPVAHGQMQCQ